MRCPKCDTKNPDDGRYCSHCGVPLTPSKEEPSQEASTQRTVLQDLEVGTTFAGRYQVLEELGKGGTGRVYKVFDTEIGEKVALKLLRPEIGADKRTIERFRDELKLARKISHRNVCRMYDLGKAGNSHFITMEYVPGEDLKSSIRRIGTLSLGKFLSVAGQVCQGLVEAHRLGVVHRDLKPQNVMIDAEGNVRIMDFGIARSLAVPDAFDEGVLIGTPEYISPEQVEAGAGDARSDIYALGVILYEMVTGKAPFTGESPLSVLLKHRSEKPRDPLELGAQIPPALSRLILKCLEKERERRYQKVEDIASDLRRIEKEISSAERFAPRERPELRAAKRSLRRRFLPGAVVLAAFLVVSGFLFLTPRLQDRLSGGLVFGAGPPRSVAIVSFENQTGDPAYDYLREAIPNLLITSLEQSRYLRVATWERMHDLAAQLGKKDAKVIDKDLGFELCRMDGIDLIVLGSFVKAGNVFATDVKLLDVESKKLLRSAGARGEGVASILKEQVDVLSREIARGVGLSERRVETVKKPIAEATTSSIEAYQYFMRGRDELEKYYLDDARQFLAKAVELDPKFAHAFLALATTCFDLGDTKGMQEALERAKALAANATRKEKLYIDLQYAAMIERNSEKVGQILKQLQKAYPREKQVYQMQADRDRVGDRLTEAVGGYEKALQLDPAYGPSINGLAYAYMELGEYQKAIDYFKKYASVIPGHANPFDSMGEVYFRTGDLDEAIAKFEEVLDIKPDFGSDYRIAYLYGLKEDYGEAVRWIDGFIEKTPSPARQAEAFYWRGFYDYWLGRMEPAFDALGRGQVLAESVGNEDLRAYGDWMRAWMYYHRGEPEKSRAWFRKFTELRLRTDAPNRDLNLLRSNFWLALVDLKEGNLASAREKLSEAESFEAKLENGRAMRVEAYLDLLRAEALLAEGAAGKALNVYQERERPRTRFPWMLTTNLLTYNLASFEDLPARAYARMGLTDKAIEEYERLVTFEPKSAERHLVRPLFHYNLAGLYEEKGQKAKAIAQYRTFLQIWKEADPGLKEVADAGRRAVRLEKEDAR